MKGEVLVKARPRIQYDMSGKPTMYFEQGAGARGGPSSKRERVAGALGGAVGVLGGLTGKHRSLGSLLGSMYAGGLQSAGLARGVAGKTVGRGRRAELALEEQSRAKRGRDKGVERMQRRVERAEEAQARRDAPAGANTRGPLGQLRDVLVTARTPDYMRRDFREAEAAEAERQAQAQAKQQRREVSRQDLARARQLREYTPRQLEQFQQVDPQGFERLMAIDAALGGIPNPYSQVSGPTLGQLVPNAQPTTVLPLQTAPSAQAVLEAGERVDPNHGDHDHEGLAAQLGQQVAEEEEPVMGLSASQLRAALEMGLNEQG